MVLSIVGCGSSPKSSNHLPIAAAGAQSITLLNSAVLDGSQSRDEDGVDDIVNYAWYEGSKLLYSGTNSTLTQSSLSVGLHTFTLTVTDKSDTNSSDTVQITVDNPTLAWSKTVGGSDAEFFRDIVIDDTGNFYAMGDTLSNDGDITDDNNGSIDALLVKFDASGNKLWDRTIGGSAKDYFRDLVIDDSGDLYVVGFTTSNDGSMDALLVKFDSDGTMLWHKTIGGNGWDGFLNIILDKSGNFYAVGFTGSTNGIYDGLIVKLDSDGNILWNKTVGGTTDDRLHDIVIDSNNNLYVTGYTNSNDNDITDGNLLWDKTVGGSKLDRFNNLIIDGDDNLYVIGSTYSGDNDISGGNHGDKDAWIIKFGSDGTTLWDRTIGGTQEDGFKGITMDSSGDLYAIGVTKSNDNDITDGNKGDFDALLVKLDNDGNTLGIKTVGGSGSDNFEDVKIDSNGNLVIAGSTSSNDGDISDGNQGLDDTWLVKF